MDYEKGSHIIFKVIEDDEMPAFRLGRLVSVDKSDPIETSTVNIDLDGRPISLKMNCGYMIVIDVEHGAGRPFTNVYDVLLFVMERFVFSDDNIYRVNEFVRHLSRDELMFVKDNILEVITRSSDMLSDVVKTLSATVTYLEEEE